MTSFAFMFELVPEPVWKTSIGNWSSNSPAAMRSPAVAMRSARSWSSSPRSALTRAAAALIRPSQRATGIGMGSPETGKLAIAFSVSGPHRACFSAASATAASVAPGGQTLRMQPLALTDAQAFWTPAGVYLNTASYGLPPTTAWDALQGALDDWRGGRTSWEHWGEPAEEARASFARLVGVPVETVAIGPNVSTFVGQVAASIPDGSRVLAPDVEFTSLLFPFLVQEHRGVTVRLVARAELADAIGPDVDVVAFSAVQMATGEVADLDAIASARPSTAC